MRAIIGYLLLHAALIGTGGLVLRALGLAPPGTGVRRWLAAGGPALITGVTLVVPATIVLLVVGVRLTLVTVAAVCAGYGLLAWRVGGRRRAGGGRVGSRSIAAAGWAVASRVVAVLGGAYVLIGIFAFGRLSTVSDDARIWSLRGLTLTYFHRLIPTIFENQVQSGGHPVYPLLQPALEAIVSEAMGGPQLRFFHAELWVLFAAGVWTGGYLLARSGSRSSRRVPFWAVILGLLAVTPTVLANVALGDADVTASMFLALGSLSIGLWLELGADGLLGYAAIALAAAAGTKDEDLLASGVILVVTAIVIMLVRYRDRGASRRRVWPFACALLYFLAVVLPWRIWTSAHDLTDSVEPPLPHALSPAYIFARGRQFHQTASAMLTQSVSRWGLFAALFLVTCLITFVGRRDKRLAGYYLACVTGIVLALLWLYTTTRVSLAFLLPTSMNRTVDLFMIPAALATAHLVARLPDPDPPALI